MVKNLPGSAGEVGLILASGRSLELVRIPTPVFLPGKSHGQRRLAGYSHGVAKSWTRLSD